MMVGTLLLSQTLDLAPGAILRVGQLQSSHQSKEGDTSNDISMALHKLQFAIAATSYPQTWTFVGVAAYVTFRSLATRVT